MSSAGGALLSRDADKVVGLSARMEACFDDYRDPTRTEHSLEALVRQRVFGLALGYEDLNDHDEIRRDSMLALACGRGDLTGEQRARVRDRAYPLAGSSTLNRMELGCPDTAAGDRYKKIVADQDELDGLLVDVPSHSASSTAACRIRRTLATSAAIFSAQCSPEPLVTQPRQRRMVGNRIMEVLPAEPAHARMHPDLRAQTPGH